jgi:hypothetical protein
MNNIPEEIEAMAFFIGQSNQIDNMMIEKPSTLVTSADTLKQGMHEYLSQQRRIQSPPPTAPAPPPSPFAHPPSNLFAPANGLPPQLPIPPPHDSNDDQLEFNFKPNQGERMIDLLKEISLKLSKHLNILEKIYEDKSPKDAVAEFSVESVDDSR